jgi:hypothetical protein
MNAVRKLSRHFFVLLTVACFALSIWGSTGTARAEAGKKPSTDVKQGPFIFQNDKAPAGKEHTGSSSFDIKSLFDNKSADSLQCSGSCDCGSCGCYGTYSCCEGGCAACFAVACGLIS